MPYAFEHLDLIEKALRQTRFGLITDVDGTISPTAPTPEEALVSPVCRRYLSLLCRRVVLVAAISGRQAVTVRDMVRVEGMVYIGNHGLEVWAEGQLEMTGEGAAYSGIIRPVIEELVRLLPEEGIRIEDKQLTVSIHYRLHPEPEQARGEIMAALRQLPQTEKLHIMPGRRVIDLLPPGADKGTAVTGLIERYRLRGAIYLGDDSTDIDAFRAVRGASRDPGFHGLAIGVISREMPENLTAEADFTLNGVRDVERFLEWLSQAAVPPG